MSEGIRPTPEAMGVGTTSKSSPEREPAEVRPEEQLQEIFFDLSKQTLERDDQETFHKVVTGIVAAREFVDASVKELTVAQRPITVDLFTKKFDHFLNNVPVAKLDREAADLQYTVRQGRGEPVYSVTRELTGSADLFMLRSLGILQGEEHYGHLANRVSEVRGERGELRIYKTKVPGLELWRNRFGMCSLHFGDELVQSMIEAAKAQM